MNNDISKHILFDKLNNNLAVFCTATYVTHVNNDVSKHILFGFRLNYLLLTGKLFKT